MDFSEAVAQHLAWQQRLRRILLGRERRRNPERTEAIHSQDCPLGAWLNSEAGNHGQEALFKYVEEQHKLSHELAIQMVLDEGCAGTSMEVILQIGQFHISSKNLLEALENLRRNLVLSEVPLCAAQSGFFRGEFPPAPDVPA